MRVRVGLCLAAAVAVGLFWLLKNRDELGPVGGISNSSQKQPLKPARQPQVAPPSPDTEPGSRTARGELSSLSTWLKREGAQLDHKVKDPQAKALELKQIAAKLTAQQITYLKKTAVNTAASAGEKILSTYMLIQSGALGELVQVITEPLGDSGPHEPHSEGELKGMQEKSLRIMAIDALVDRAKQDPKARELLVSQIHSIQDPYIKSYAERRLSELP